jgi:hypothetical protein
MKWEIEKLTKEVVNMSGVFKNIRDVKHLLKKQNALAKKNTVNIPLAVFQTKVHDKKTVCFHCTRKSVQCFHFA